MNHTGELRISSAAELCQLIARCRRISLLEDGHIKFELSALSEQESVELETQANRLWQECGCSAGAAASLVAVFGWVLWLQTVPGQGANLSWLQVIGFGILINFLVSVVAKISSILMARRRLMRRLKVVLSSLQA